MEQRKLEIGSHVVYTDEVARSHNAIVTAVHGTATAEPACNLVYVSDDESKQDPYGRQIERKTSIVHRSKQSAHGFFWDWSEQS